MGCERRMKKGGEVGDGGSEREGGREGGGGKEEEERGEEGGGGRGRGGRGGEREREGGLFQGNDQFIFFLLELKPHPPHSRPRPPCQT